MRESWTDERLDDFRAETARRLDGIDARLEKVDERFEKVDARFDKVDAKFERLEERLDLKFERINERFDSLHRMMLQFGAGAMITFIVGFASLIVAQL